MSEAKARDVRYEDLSVGEVFSFDKTISREDGLLYARLTGDLNPLHIDAEYGQQSPFKQNLAHGMFVSGLFSTLIGMHSTGLRSLYVSQTLEFRAPVFYGDAITVRGTVIAKSDSVRLVTLKTDVLKGGVLAVAGVAKVRMFEG